MREPWMDAIRREYVAEVVSVGKQQKGDGWVLALAPRQGMKYPDSFYGKDWALVKGLQPGQRYTFVLEQGKLKKNKTEGSTNPFDYFEDLLEIKPAPAAEAAAPVVTAQAQAPVASNSGRVSEFRSPEQIIRSYALEHATALAVALIGQGNPLHESIRTPEVLLIAVKYERYITTGDIPAVPNPPLTPKAQADKDFGELLGPGETLSGKPVATPAKAQTAPTPTGGSQTPLATGGHPAASPPTVKRPPESVKSYGELLRACNIDFHLQPKQVYVELNVGSQSELTETPSECYLRIAAVHGQQPPQASGKEA